MASIIDAMKLHRIRINKDQGLRPWELTDHRNRTMVGMLPRQGAPTPDGAPFPA